MRCYCRMQAQAALASGHEPWARHPWCPKVGPDTLCPRERHFPAWIQRAAFYFLRGLFLCFDVIGWLFAKERQR